MELKDTPEGTEQEDHSLLTSEPPVHIINSTSKDGRQDCVSESSVGFKKMESYMAKKARKTFTMATLFSWFPFLTFARGYDLGCFVGDLIAGLTTALTVIPQGIGYAPLAGLPLQYGLYASIVPGFAYAIFGTIKEATVGPTAVNALMSYSYAGPSVIHALTLSFYVGLIEILAGILNLGGLISYISAPVISAFTSAVSIQVATSQVKGLLGLKVPGRGFVNTWIGVFKNITSIRPCDAALGFACIGILLFLRKLKDLRWLEGTDSESKRAKILRKTKWAISISRNSMVVLTAAIIAYVVTETYEMKDALIITGSVEEGLPQWQLPWEFNLNMTNSTLRPHPIDMAEEFGIGLLMLPLVSMLQHLAIAKFYTPPGATMDASQEIVALGVCQFVGSFIGSMPVTASFGRSAIQSASGVRTTFAGCVTALIILCACAFLTPHFAYIPTSALSAVIICAMIFTIEVEILLPIWRSKKLDIVPYALTLLIGLFVSPGMGMIVGTISHLCILLYSSGNPKVFIKKETLQNIDYMVVVPDRALFFPSVETMRNQLTSKTTSEVSEVKDKEDLEANVAKTTEKLPIVLDFSKVCEMDFTAAKGIRALCKVLKKSGQNTYFYAVNENIESVLQGADPSLLVTYSSMNEIEQRLLSS